MNSFSRRVLELIENFSFQNVENKSLALAILNKDPIDNCYVKLFSGPDYFPIEKLKADNSWTRTSSYRSFKSSGTTSSSRSISKFSRDGLFLYKINSIVSFGNQLKKTGKPIHDFRGLSLIPDSRTWPESSLAQMVTWFSEIFPVEFIDSQNYHRIIEILNEDEKRPKWVFGTAFHYVNLFDLQRSTRGTNEPKSYTSYFFETGGTKGKSRAISRENLYKLIRDLFNIPISHIGSQYGMCELSCQAWSFFDKRYKKNPYDAPYKFEPHVNLSITRHTKHRREHGTGSLIISDPSRVDLPYPLRTQDMVNLRSDGTFKILKRVQNSALKGCSLLVEEITEIVPPGETKQHCAHQEKVAVTTSMSCEIYHSLLQLFKSDQFMCDLKSEFNDDLISQYARDDMLCSMPVTDHAFLKACTTAKPKTQSILIIQPNTHSFSSIYPLTIASCTIGCVSIRLPDPKINNLKPLRSVISIIQNHRPLEVLDHNFRIGQNKVVQDSILVYGSKETIEQIKRKTDKKIIPYSDAISISIIFDTNLNNLSLSMKDFMSLNQLGCMSSRALFVPLTEKSKVIKYLETTTLAISMSDEDVCSIDHEEVRLRDKKIKYLDRKTENCPLFPIYEGLDDFSFEFIFSNSKFVLPIVFFESLVDLNQFVKNTKYIKYISTDRHSLLAMNDCIVKDVGSLNIQKWDGLHENKPLLQ